MCYRIVFLFSLIVTTHLHAQVSSKFVVCYDYGCKSTKSIEFDAQQWSLIESIFTKPALSAWHEKQKIRQAIALMEEFSGILIGTHQDKAGNYPGYDIPNQQDCIDESTNTMQYLSALQQRELLVWHELVGKKRRIVWFYTHWTAVIRQVDNQKQYAVDSWHRDNGEPPYIQLLSDWQSKTSFPDTLNP